MSDLEISEKELVALYEAKVVLERLAVRAGTNTLGGEVLDDAARDLEALIESLRPAAASR